MTVIASLITSLGLESSQFTSGLDQAAKEMRKTQKQFATIGGNLQKIGAVMSVGLTAPFAALTAGAIPAAVESQQAMAQVNAALASMGPVAGRTAEQLAAVAGKLQDTSLFDDDDIMKSVTANLLTFGKVSGDTFDRAEQDIVDYAARTGRDLQSTTIMVGKALQDPIKGVTALQKVGIKLSDQQREQVAAMMAVNNVAGAQGIILGELERQNAGAAKAQRDATPTAAQDQAWRTFQENVGAIGLKVLPVINNALAGLLNAFNQLSPGMQETIVAGGGIVAALGPVVGTMGTLTKVVGTSWPAFAKLGAVMTTTVAPALLTVGRAAIGLAIAGGPLTLIAAAATAAYFAWKNWDKIAPVIRELYNTAKAYLLDKLQPVFDLVRKGIKGVHDAFDWLTDKVVRHSYVPEMVDGIADEFGRLDAIMVNPALRAIGQVHDAFKDMPTVVPSLAGADPNAANDNSEMPLSSLDRLAGALRDVGEAGTGAFGKVAGAVSNAIIEIDKARAGTEQLGGSLSQLTSGLQALFGKKVGGIVGSIAAIGASAAKAFRIDGARAMGGPVLPNGNYLIGEQGPELLRMGSRGGSIVPNHELGGAVQINVSVQEGALFRPTVSGIANDRAVAVSTSVQRAGAMRQRQALA